MGVTYKELTRVTQAGITERLYNSFFFFCITAADMVNLQRFSNCFKNSLARI
jgi:hypothetical protein